MTEQPETIFLLPSVWLANESAAILLNRRSVKGMQGEKKVALLAGTCQNPPQLPQFPGKAWPGENMA